MDKLSKFIRSTILIKKIENHYNEQAELHQNSPKSTMPDLFIRKLEITKIQECIEKFNIKNNTRILEIGCGNGYTITKLSKKFSCDFVGVDSNHKMIELASKRKLRKVKFRKDDILRSNLESNSFDIAYTERCLINLENELNQKKAIKEIHRILKKGGIFIMVEAFEDGLKELNSARKALGLKKIPPAWHNYYFNKKKLKKIFEGRFRDVISKSKTKFNYESFLSSYYFGSRVIYPALIEGKNKIIYNNDFVKFFSLIPNYGNYSQIQVCVVQKI